jgi:hypothetical protein
MKRSWWNKWRHTRRKRIVRPGWISGTTVVFLLCMMVVETRGQSVFHSFMSVDKLNDSMLHFYGSLYNYQGAYDTLDLNKRDSIFVLNEATGQISGLPCKLSVDKERKTRML